MNSAEIRDKFLQYFASQGHTIVPSSSLVPGNDPTLLFTNSGMVQFKDVFLGQDKRAYSRATSSQRSVRAGGKHNDLENVGYTARHHTFFEMLGNFSFGDYFKRDAIKFAWELLTEVYRLPKDKLWVTVYQEDDEAYGIWAREMGVPESRIVRIGDNKGARYASDNFWQMADTGPCGPCSEIFFDHGPEVWGGPPGSPEADGDRYIEIWNLVFMQFNRDEAGVLHPLPKPCVDTGMGLERIAAVLQHVHSNYEIDLFQRLIAAAARETACQDLANPSLRVIADHIRACAFLVVDGVIPSNEGRGYVLRRIIRRAIRHGYQLGQKGAFFHQLVTDLEREMGGAYPELSREAGRVTQVLRAEEERFAETIEHGMELLEGALSRRVFAKKAVAARLGIECHEGIFFEGEGTNLFADLFDKAAGVLVRMYDLTELRNEPVEERLTKNLQWLNEFGKTNGITKFVPTFIVGDRNLLPDAVSKLIAAADFSLSLEVISDDDLISYRVLDGETVFKLYDTHGFPFDLTADVCRERGVTIDEAGFEQAMNRQRETARAAGKFKMAAGLEYDGPATVFHGYDTLTHAGTIVALYKSGDRVNILQAGETGVVVLDHTPFYAESGGQVGDRGELDSVHGAFAVDDTVKIQSDVYGHHGTVMRGALSVGNAVNAAVDAAVRQRTMRNHSATHLMHKALREVLGPHVQQKGSLVDATRTRFDFAHHAPLSDDEIRRVETLVNGEVLTNPDANCRVMSMDDAKKLGAMALFGEKYGDQVRVVDLGSSRELCGGTHVKRTGDIGLFKIVAESGVAAGVRRVEAVTGDNALALVQEQQATLAGLADALKAQPQELSAKVGQVLDHVKALEKELAKLKSKLASSQGDDLAAHAVDVKGVKVLAAQLDGADVAALRETMDKLKDKLKSAAIVLSAVADGKVSLIAGVTADLTGKLKAGELVNVVAQQVGGKGGGRPDMAQAGGTDPSGLPKALASVAGWVDGRL